MLYQVEPSRYTALRDYCTCPHCEFAWVHPETRDMKRNWVWVQARYQGPVQCSECHQWSESGRSFWQGNRRRKIAAPVAAHQQAPPQPQTKTTRKPPKPPFWARTRKTRPAKERDHACEEER